MAGYALIARFSDRQSEILFVVARDAVQSGHSVISFSAKRWRRMDVPIVTLVRLVTGRVAVHASWAGDDPSSLTEQRP
jgi:hypothetical protein